MMLGDYKKINELEYVDYGFIIMVDIQHANKLFKDNKEYQKWLNNSSDEYQALNIGLISDSTKSLVFERPGFFKFLVKINYIDKDEAFCELL